MTTSFVKPGLPASMAPTTNRNSVEQDNTEVTLHFIAWKLLRDNGNKPIYLSARGKAYRMPALGSPFRVPRYLAQELMYRAQMYDEKLGYQPGLTEDPLLATAVAAAYADGVIENMANFAAVVQNQQLQTAPLEALEAELARRRAAAENPAPELTEKPEKKGK